MPRIRVLPPQLVNRIAAGECVERPASVVKELVENALDAGATSIQIDVLDGGRELISVRDDGCGMSPDDLRLCVHPHATSKLAGEDDLFNIHTLGFRGEALPSIGSVARLEITSRPHDAELAYTIRVEGGEVSGASGTASASPTAGAPGTASAASGRALAGPTPCNAPPGTTVAVRDLFYCVPARRKFLRTTQTEMGQITEQLARLALPKPNVAFTLRHGKRVVHNLAAIADAPAERRSDADAPAERRSDGDAPAEHSGAVDSVTPSLHYSVTSPRYSVAALRQRISDLYGDDLGRVLLPIEREGGGVRVEGLVAPPAESRGASKWEYVFVNGRFIRDRFVSHAVKEAYRSLIDPSRYPVVFIFITIDPHHVDVNVHPTKVEVRWRDSNYIHGQVLAALRDKFLSTRLDVSLRPPAEQDAYRDRVRNAMVDFFTGRGSANEVRRRADDGGSAPAHGDRAIDDVGTRERGDVGWEGRTLPPSCAPTFPPSHLPAAPDASEFASVGREDPSTVPAFPRSHDPAAPEPAARGAALSTPRALQLHNTYLVVETDDGLMIIDQHALHERVIYEELRRRIADRPLESQRLLMPEVVRVPADRIEALETHAETLARLGLDLTAAGPQSVALHAFPSLLDRADRAAFVRDLLDRLSERGARPEADTLLHELLDMMACKAAVKAGDPLTSDEIAALLASRDAAERSSNCPHGRPTTLRMTLRELEKQFKRR